MTIKYAFIRENKNNRWLGNKTIHKEKMLHALSVLSEFGEVCGLPHKKESFLSHPFPMVKDKCVKWLDDMCEVLEEGQCEERAQDN